ncbi:hypothetical protein [Carboxylicivirga marina]|uniref:hypothetical protein n=1 Tax=Carboxylicivirga marina TaxID=2800988 RepID=UPI002598C051|nr:hypothetical protein [uncultured Carboxylicivirga sp.]
MTESSIELKGRTLYITFEESKNIWKNRLLIVLNIVAYIGLFYISNYESSSQHSFVLFIGGGLIIFFSLTWTTIKNTMVKEKIIINEKSLSHQKSYGIAATNLNTIHTPFGVDIDFAIKYTEEEIGEILFYKIDKNNYVEMIYKASFDIRETEFNEISQNLALVYAKDLDSIESVSLN